MRTNLPTADVVSLATTDLEYERRKIFGDDGKIFVLRPDGYLGFRSPIGLRVELPKFARQEALV